jgi:hypothetical protein
MSGFSVFSPNLFGNKRWINDDVIERMKQIRRNFRRLIEIVKDEPRITGIQSSVELMIMVKRYLKKKRGDLSLYYIKEITFASLFFWNTEIQRRSREKSRLPSNQQNFFDDFLDSLRRIPVLVELCFLFVVFLK